MNTTEASSLHRICFDTDNIPASERFDAWRANTTPLFVGHLAPGITPDKFHFRNELVVLGQSYLGRTWQRGISAYHVTGTREQQGAAPDVFFLQTYLRGGFSGYHGSHPMTAETNDVVLLDSMVPMQTWIGGDEELIFLAIPRQLLTAQLEDRFVPVHHILPAANPSAAMLRQAMTDTWDRLPEMNTEDAARIEAMLVGALAGLLRISSIAPPTDEPASLIVIRAYIDDNLHDPGLGAETLCQRFHCSRATLYRLFAPVDGISTYIRQQRLECCHADLLASRLGDTVARIALRWGFSSEHLFSRLYRAAYGTTPGQVLRKS